jgi:hypothetical protein
MIRDTEKPIPDLGSGGRKRAGSETLYIISPIVAVDHKDEPLCVLKVVSPEWSNFVLTTNVPDCKADVLVLHCLHIETYDEKKSVRVDPN